MSVHGLRDAEVGDPPFVGESRARVLDALRTADGPLAVGEVAERVGLHPNTARFHLDALTQANLAQRHREERDMPGRPRWLYSAGGAETPTGQRSYRLLAQILTSYLSSRTEDPARSAREAGEAWGRYLVERPGPMRSTDVEEANRQLTEVLREIGFAPEPAPAEQPETVLLHHCPFLEAAQEHQDVVCAVHLGLMRGVLAELNTPLRADSLDPMVAPSLCVAHLSSPVAS